MNDLKRQVRLARRRLQLQRLFSLLPWTVSSTLLIAALAVAATKIWPLAVRGDVWAFSWIGGALVAGTLIAIVMTYLRRHDDLDAAIEIDQRFGLKERVSSCLSLTEVEQETAAGQALIKDAIRRVSNVDVNERFGVSANRWALMPCGLAVLAFALTLLADAQPDSNNSTANAALTSQEKKTVKNSTQKLIKKSERLKREAVEKGLEDASNLFEKLEAGVESLSQKDDLDREKALVKLNELAKQVQQRQQALLDREDLRKQLNSLKDLKQGPANRMAKAMRQGDFNTAMHELKKMQQAMKNGEMSAEQKQRLAEQLKQMQEKLQQMADAQEQAKRDLEEQIQQKLAQGDRQAAGKLQNQLDQLQQQDKQMQRMADIAQKMGQAAEAMQQGDMQQAAAQMSDLADGLDAMQQELEEMAMLEDALDQISAAKGSMNCEACQGMGCAQCQGMGDMMGMGMGQGQGMGDGFGMGEGQGRGERPEEETQYGTYDSQVRAKPEKGRAVVAGTAFGPNRPGQALEDVKSAIESARTDRDDPLTNQRLPKPQRELTREYFGTFSGEPE